MVTTIFGFLLQAAVIFLAIAIPGFLAAIAFFKKSGVFSTVELFFIGIVLGMFIPGLLGLLEGNIGILFSPMLDVLNVVLLTVVSIGYIVLTNTKVLPEKKPSKNTLLFAAGIVIVLFLAWWIRMQSLSPYFYDFDPYWYNHMTQFIIQGGQIPVHDDFMWYPDISSHRVVPLLAYIEAGWYHLFALANGMNQFDFNTMTMVSAMYPPIIGMLIAFAAYLWMSREYDQRIALIVAGILAFTPAVVSKSVSGEFLLEAFTLFSVIFFYAMYNLAIKSKDIRITILCAFSIVIGLFGANMATPAVFLMAGTVGIIALVNFMKGEVDKDFNKMNLIIAVIVLLMYLLYLPYRYPNVGFTDAPVFSLPLIAVGFAYCLQYLSQIEKTRDDRLLYLSVILIAGIALLIFTPLGHIISPITDLFSSATSYTTAVSKTIAEQIAASTDFYGIAGILGLTIQSSLTPYIFSVVFILVAALICIKLYNNLEIKNNGSTIGIVLAFAVAVIGMILLELTFTFSIVPFVLSLAFVMVAAPFCIQLFTDGKIKSKEVIIAIFGVFPPAIIGMTKAKYTPVTGLLIPIAFGIILGETYKLANRDKKILNGVLVIGLLALLLQFLPYTYTIFDSINYANIDITNTAYISTVCSSMGTGIQQIQSSTSNILTGPTINSKETEYGLYCNRIPDYWLNTLFWIRDNVGINGRITSWWDYGHWIESFSQSKGVIGNTQSDPVMIGDVADKIVSNTPSAMISDMKLHNSSYLMLDQDLIGKWGALVYLACSYDNKTTLAQNPGQSQCDQMNSPEILYVPVNPTSSDICNIASNNGTAAIKLYSSFGQTYGFGYYCSIGGTMPLVYENGTASGISNLLPEGQVQINNQAGQAVPYMEFMAVYTPNSSDTKGLFYNSIFYQGFFEGSIPGMTQVYPNTYSNQPNIPVRVYKIE